MKFIEVYTGFNAFYYKKIKCIIERANKATKINDVWADFLRKINEKEIDLDRVLYKKLVDDYEEIDVDGKKYGILPMGLKNDNVPEEFVAEKEKLESGNFGRLNTFIKMFLKKAEFGPLYYHSDATLRQTFRRVCGSYIEHYQNSLGETWSEEDFYARLSDLSYLSVKYAVDLETEEIFAIGFFGALTKKGAGGKALTDAELYVMPEFRGMGIARRMVGLTFELAKSDGIENFDSITYRVPSCDALSFWQKIGASVTGLTHIEGSISDIIETIDKSQKKGKSF